MQQLKTFQRLVLKNEHRTSELVPKKAWMKCNSACKVIVLSKFVLLFIFSYANVFLFPLLYSNSHSFINVPDELYMLFISHISRIAPICNAAMSAIFVKHLLQKEQYF